MAKARQDIDAPTNVGAAIKAVTELHGFDSREVVQKEIDGVSIVTVPAGMSLVDLTSKLDARRGGPRRIKGSERADTLESFIKIVNRHKAHGTVVWAKSDGGSSQLTAVIDYHLESDEGAGPTPAWCEHRVGYAFPFSDAFKRWTNARLLSQRDFLKFVQDRARELVDPVDLDTPPVGTLARDVMLDTMRAAGRAKADREAKVLADFYGDAAHLVDVARRMSSRTSSSVKEVDRGLGGVTVTFEDEKRVEGVEQAREFYLVEVDVFRGGDKVVMPARLRAEATDGGLLIGLVLVGIDRVIEQAFRDGCELVAEKTGCPVYHGEPAS